MPAFSFTADLTRDISEGMDCLGDKRVKDFMSVAISSPISGRVDRENFDGGIRCLGNELTTDARSTLFVGSFSSELSLGDLDGSNL